MIVYLSVIAVALLFWCMLKVGSKETPRVKQ